MSLCFLQIGKVATARREQKAPTLEQIKHVISNMPEDTEIERRNRTLIAFTLLTGARDSAIASMKLKHVDLSTGSVHQDAREVKTKFSKTFMTYFFPVEEEIEEIVTDWVTYLQEVKLWGNDDPLFPATLSHWGKRTSLRLWDWREKIGAMPRRFAQSFVKRLKVPACPILIHTALEIHLFSLAKLSARPRRHSRLGVRTSAMKRY